MKTRFFFSATAIVMALFFSYVSSAQSAGSGRAGSSNQSSGSKSAQQFFYDKISTPDNTINFVIGVYVSNFKVEKRDDGSSYTEMRMGLINDEKAKSFNWTDYKVYIMLKNGDLFYNYTTQAKDGDMACNWTVDPGKTHIQYLCFDKTFNTEDIANVWVSFNDYKFFKLLQNTN